MAPRLSAVCSCLECGCVTSRWLVPRIHSVVEQVELIYLTDDPDEEPQRVKHVREGLFDQCPKCKSLDVDVFSPEGWESELRARETAARMSP